MPGGSNPADRLASTLGGLNVGATEGGSSSREPGPSSSSVTAAAGGGQRGVAAPLADRPGLLTCQVLSCLATTGKNGAPLLACAGCRYEAYCCKDHQKLDWSLHKHFCKNVGKDGPLAPVVSYVEWMTEGMNDKQLGRWDATCHELDSLSEMAKGDRHAAAVTRAKAVLSDLEAFFGRGHLGTVYALYTITQLFRIRAMYDDALSFSLRALKIVEDKFGPDDYRIVHGLDNYTSIISGLGREQDALVQQQRCLRITESACGLNSGLTASALSNMSTLLADLGRVDETVSLIRRSMAIATAWEGATSRSTGLATLRGNLADSLARLGRFDEARPLFEHALKSFELSDGRNSVVFSRIYANYAKAMRDFGDGDPTVIAEMFEHAIKVMESVYGERDLEFISTLGNCAHANARLRRWRRAADQMDRCAMLTSDEYGPGHQDTKDARGNAAIFRAMTLIRR